MKNIIKVIIALVFVLGAFSIGKYIGLEENQSVIKKLEENISFSEKQLISNENQIKKMK